MSAVKKNEMEKVTKMTNKGLDPNFIDLESGGGQLDTVTLQHTSYLGVLCMCVISFRPLHNKLETAGAPAGHMLAFIQVIFLRVAVSGSSAFSAFFA